MWNVICVLKTASYILYHVSYIIHHILYNIYHVSCIIYLCTVYFEFFHCTVCLIWSPIMEALRRLFANQLTNVHVIRVLANTRMSVQKRRVYIWHKNVMGSKGLLPISFPNVHTTGRDGKRVVSGCKLSSTTLKGDGGKTVHTKGIQQEGNWAKKMRRTGLSWLDKKFAWWRHFARADTWQTDNRTGDKGTDSMQNEIKTWRIGIISSNRISSFTRIAPPPPPLFT